MKEKNAMFSFEQGSLNNEIAEEIRHGYQSQECSGFTVEGNVKFFSNFYESKNYV